MSRKRGLCCGITAAILVVYGIIMVGINVFFDLRYPSSYEHQFIAVPRTIMGLISPVEHQNFTTVNRKISSLIDLPYTATGTNESAGTSLRISGNRHVHQILWYNKPVWISTAESNRVVAGCPYTNCAFTSGKDKRVVANSSAIIFSLSEDDMGYGPPISPRERDTDQIWIFFALESPVNLGRLHYRHAHWRRTMNWSMNYRTDADIFYSYGALETRDIVPSRDYRHIYRRKTGFAAWIVSNCGAESGRDDYVRELQNHGIPVHVYGRCGQPLETEPQTLVETYKFYISFENSLCVDYISEKFFKFFPMNTILVVRGGANYNKLLPSNAFINTADFDSVYELSQFLLKVNSSEDMYIEYLKNKDKYTVKRTLPYPICTLCERLNNKDVYRKMYDDMISYLHTDTCHSATDTAAKWWYFQSMSYILFLPLLIVTWLLILRLLYNWTVLRFLPCFIAVFRRH